MLMHAARFVACLFVQYHDMEHSLIYVELAAMIEKNWIVKSLSEFDRQLKELEKDGQITADERKSLLGLYLEKFKP
jgi:hypothetical protein